MRVLSDYFSTSSGDTLARKLGYFLTPFVVVFALLVLVGGAALTVYQASYDGLILTGVSVGGVDLGRKSLEQAKPELTSIVTYPTQGQLTLIDPASGERWAFTPEQLGVTLDAEQTLAAAYDVGRSGNPLGRLQDSFQAWYYGREVAPVIVFDENKLEAAITEVAEHVERSAVNAQWSTVDGAASYTPAQVGYQIDRSALRQSLIVPISQLRPAQIELKVHEVLPPAYDSPAVAAALQQLVEQPIRFYYPEPLADADLPGLSPPADVMQSWVRVEHTTTPDNRLEHRMMIDENAVRNWLMALGSQIYRAPENARYYFNDDTRELVLVAPHTNGRELDIEATMEQLRSAMAVGNHKIPIIVKDVIPVANSNATAAELGITELITETTTWFSGSSDERKHNIARAAANFYGIVIAPGEEFSFNRFLGKISEADGYEVGLIIFGGRTIEGVGGGVCQVSTTIYQTAFWAGFPIVERWAHGYIVPYYNTEDGPGMDATVYSPVVDFRFINNTPHYLLIENYYSEEFESLTFKFYSTSMGRKVVSSDPIITNETPAPAEDIWEFDEKVEPGTVEQYDFATGGATVTIQREVFSADGLLLDDKTFVSNYIPWPNVYRYGPGVEPGDYSLVP